jgi:hypothetical protein
MCKCMCVLVYKHLFLLQVGQFVFSHVVGLYLGSIALSWIGGFIDELIVVIKMKEGGQGIFSAYKARPVFRPTSRRQYSGKSMLHGLE